MRTPAVVALLGIMLVAVGVLHIAKRLEVRDEDRFQQFARFSEGERAWTSAQKDTQRQYRESPGPPPKPLQTQMLPTPTPAMVTPPTIELPRVQALDEDPLGEEIRRVVLSPHELLTFYGKFTSPTPFSKADVGRVVGITGDEVTVDGKLRAVVWGDAKHHDCNGTIQSVEERDLGKVLLKGGEQKFENPSGESRYGKHRWLSFGLAYSAFAGGGRSGVKYKGGVIL